MNAVRRYSKEIGDIMRFVTPILVGIALFVLSDIKGSVTAMNSTISVISPRLAVVESRLDNIEANRLNNIEATQRRIEAMERRK